MKYSARLRLHWNNKRVINVWSLHSKCLLYSAYIIEAFTLISLWSMLSDDLGYQNNGIFPKGDSFVYS
jgi:hypothetical protein